MYYFANYCVGARISLITHSASSTCLRSNTQEDKCTGYIMWEIGYSAKVKNEWSYMPSQHGQGKLYV